MQWMMIQIKKNDDDDDHRVNNETTTKSKSFEYKTKIIGSTTINNNALDTEAVALLKYFSNFWRFLDLSLINCGIELYLSWSKDCIISEIFNTPEIDANPASVPPIPHAPTT